MNRKLDVVCSPHMGYCFGVKRAMSIIDKGISSGGSRVYTIGDVIHNRQAVERLKIRGMMPVGSLDEISEGDTLVIRAHGVDPKILEMAKLRKIRILDTTCPFVGKSHDHVKKLADESSQVIIIGDASHPEVRGIAGRAYGGALIIDSTEEAERVEVKRKAGVVIQTTYSRDKAMAIIEILKKRISDLTVFDTICQATMLRREATLELAREVDMILVIGGRESSNTRRLYQMCIDKGIKARFIETAGEIDPSWFKGCVRVGLTTGTSTPDWVIEEVLTRLSTIDPGI